MHKNGNLHNLHTQKTILREFFSCFVKTFFTKLNWLLNPRFSVNLLQITAPQKPLKTPNNRLIGAFNIRVILMRSSHPLELRVMLSEGRTPVVEISPYYMVFAVIHGDSSTGSE